MKDNLLELLLNLFEKTLSQIKESSIASNSDPNDVETEITESFISSDVSALDFSYLKAAKDNSMRVFSFDERIKLTKASYQFLTRMRAWGIIAQEAFEVIIHQLLFSSSRFVSLEETKWTIRDVLANSLDSEQLAFLDLILYHQEDQLTLQ